MAKPTIHRTNPTLDLDELDISELIRLADAWDLTGTIFWTRFLEQHIDPAVATLRDTLEAHHAEHQLAGMAVPAGTRSDTRSARLASAFAVHVEPDPEDASYLCEQSAKPDARYVLVEKGEGPRAGKVWYTLHATEADAYQAYADQDEPDNWVIAAVVDLGANLYSSAAPEETDPPAETTPSVSSPIPRRVVLHYWTSLAVHVDTEAGKIAKVVVKDEIDPHEEWAWDPETGEQITDPVSFDTLADITGGEWPGWECEN